MGPGVFTIAVPNIELNASSVLILAATQDQLDAYDRCYGTGSELEGSVVIIGAGRVGRAAAQAFAEADIGYKIIEQQPERILDEHYVLGDAADIAVLEAAGIRTATGVLITAHDDDINIYLTIYCRRLQPHLQIVARANLDRNVSTLYRAGADDVLSYASTGAAAVWNHFRGNDTLVVADGLDVFRSTVPVSMRDKTLATSGLREDRLQPGGRRDRRDPGGQPRRRRGADRRHRSDPDRRRRRQERLANLNDGWRARLRRRMA